MQPLGWSGQVSLVISTHLSLHTSLTIQRICSAQLIQKIVMPILLHVVGPELLTFFTKVKKKVGAQLFSTRRYVVVLVKMRVSSTPTITNTISSFFLSSRMFTRARMFPAAITCWSQPRNWLLA